MYCILTCIILSFHLLREKAPKAPSLACLGGTIDLSERGVAHLFLRLGE